MWLDSHACRLMRFTPVTDGIQFVGSDLHISTGSTEVEDVILSDSSAEILLRADAGARCGALYIYSEKAPVSIDFAGMEKAEYTMEENIVKVSLTNRSRSGEQYIKLAF